MREATPRSSNPGAVVRAPGTSTAIGGRSLVPAGVIATGGMGRVELALRQEGRFRRLYALKRIHAHLLDENDRMFRDMFLDEGRVAGLIDHPNVVGVLDVGDDEEGPFLLMQYVHGLSLGRLLSLSRAAEMPFPTQVAIRIAIDIARGLHAAHETRDDRGRPLGVVHRDLSPQNVLVGFDGVARVTDFGIAKALGQSTRTATGVAKGKYCYMAPEQVAFRPVDRRADLFALGILIYEMLAGRRLYVSGSNGDREDPSAEGPRRILEEPPPDIGQERSGLPPALVELTFDLLAKSPDDRPRDAQEVASRLEAILATLLVVAPPSPTEQFVAVIAAEDRAKSDERLRVAMDRAEGREASAADGAASAIRAARPPPARARWLALAALLVIVAAIGAATGSGIALMRDRAGPASEEVVPSIGVGAPRPAPSVSTPAEVEVARVAAGSASAPSEAAASEEAAMSPDDAVSDDAVSDDDVSAASTAGVAAAGEGSAAADSAAAAGAPPAEAADPPGSSAPSTVATSEERPRRAAARRARRSVRRPARRDVPAPTADRRVGWDVE
jgi:hypothetical protein